jgi:pimeloyl-ACP methyl ester carboxylesterase
VRFITAILLLLLGSACNRNDRPTAIDQLHPCVSDEGPTDAYCGSYRVFENRATRQGRTIDLKIVLLPALSNEPKPDPLFFLAGGPGQGAAQLARQVRDALRRVQADRDIVLVDQRGTGKSNPLNCEPDEPDSLKSLNDADEIGLERLRKCLKELDADPRLYVTTIAMDDLDDVRQHLGYDDINLYGGSYGTRAALVYLRQHGDHVRSIILDGVAPPDMRLPLYFARDAQRSFDKLLADCEADAACGAKYPNLAARARALFERLEKASVQARLVHPRTGQAEEVRVNAQFVTNVVVNALYLPIASSLIPELLARAESNDFQGLLALAIMGEGTAQSMSYGMHLSVVCAEDFPRIKEVDVVQHSAGTMFARHLIDSRLKACEVWPKGAVEPAYYEPVTSDVPVLILSGDLDPVTPPSWGENVLPHLRNAKHVVVPGTGHGTMSTGCGGRLVRQFLDRGTAQDLDTTCTQALRRPPFFVTPAGPDPAGNRSPAQP